MELRSVLDRNWIEFEYTTFIFIFFFYLLQTRPRFFYDFLKNGQGRIFANYNWSRINTEQIACGSMNSDFFLYSSRFKRLLTVLKMDWESFYDTHPSPSDYESIITVVENFVCSHENEKIVLVTVSILSRYKYFLSDKITQKLLWKKTQIYKFYGRCTFGKKLCHYQI